MISTIACLFTVATTHLLIGTPCNSLNVKPSNEAKISRNLLQLVSQANNGAPIHHVLLTLILSTNDAIVFVFKGTEQKLEGWYLVDKQSREKNSLQS